MKASFIINGKTQIVLTPENDIETSILNELAKSPVDFQLHQTLQIGLESVNNSVIISKQTANT